MKLTEDQRARMDKARRKRMMSLMKRPKDFCLYCMAACALYVVAYRELSAAGCPPDKRDSILVRSAAASALYAGGSRGASKGCAVKR